MFVPVSRTTYFGPKQNQACFVIVDLGFVPVIPCYKHVQSEYKSNSFPDVTTKSSGSRHSMAQEKLVEQTERWQASDFV